MQRVMHQKLAFAYLHHSSTKTGNVIHRRLHGPIIRADNVGIMQADSDNGEHLHFGVHRLTKLLLLRRWAEVGVRPHDRQCRQHR